MGSGPVDPPIRDTDRDRRNPKPIGNVVKHGSIVTIYDEDGHVMANFTCSSQSVVTHFSATSINVQTGRQICVFNASGKPRRNYTV